jgi:hypothetical protein
MTEITFSADADPLDRAEQIDKEKGTTLEEEVRQWLDDFGEEGGSCHQRTKKRKRNAHKSPKG